jgi:hypothetical protein
MTDPTINEAFLQSSGGRTVVWLADAPMFIDADQISALYNAVAKPEHETEKITLNLEKSREFRIEGKVSVEGEIGVAKWLGTVFPFLDAKGKVGAEVAPSGQSESKEGTEIELRPVDTPQRQLVQLALHYWINLPYRTRAVSESLSGDWLESSFITALPRGLVFVEFPPQTAFMPMAAEVEGGAVEVIYPDLIASFVAPKDKDKVPTYPEPAYFKDKPEELNKKRHEYWNFFRNNFSSTASVEAIERRISTAAKPIRWIDYRIPLGDEMPYLHLHVAPRSRYDTGTFAYQLVKRGYKHGLRVVGTMKSEPAMNVLAIFER